MLCSEGRRWMQRRDLPLTALLVGTWLIHRPTWLTFTEFNANLFIVSIGTKWFNYHFTCFRWESTRYSNIVNFEVTIADVCIDSKYLSLKTVNNNVIVTIERSCCDSTKFILMTKFSLTPLRCTALHNTSKPKHIVMDVKSGYSGNLFHHQVLCSGASGSGLAKNAYGRPSH